MRPLLNTVWAAGISLVLFSCGNGNTKLENNTSQTATPSVVTPDFIADSAYASIQKQLSFGARVPGTPAQKQCADWMASQLSVVCDSVYRQDVTVKGGDGKMLPCYNVIGAINPQASRRILLVTHWDSRPWADQDVTDKDKPVMAADDGASGVGVLIELARAIKTKGLSKDLGIDIFFTDVEDYGKDVWGENSYCLGTQYWALHPHVPNYKADFGILLDMVGAKGAQFPMEGISAKYAGAIQQQIWQAAASAGYSSYFRFTEGPMITDDHLPLNQMTGIKTVDIIHLTDNQQKPFAPHWHTHADDIQIIDKATLKAVGQTILYVIYQEAATPTAS